MFGGHGVGALTPVVDRRDSVGEAQPGALFDERLFVVGEHDVAPRLVGPPEQVDVIERQHPGAHRGGRVRHGGQLAGPAQLDVGRRQRTVRVAGQTGCSRAGAVCGPHPTTVPPRQQPGGDGAEPGPFVLQGDHRVVQFGIRQ